MISSFLSKIFWIAFVIVLINGITNIICQITLKPLEFRPTKNSLLTFGKPGLVFNALISNRQAEKYAPDTTINFSYRTKLGGSSNGAYPMNTSLHDYKKDLDSIITQVKNKGGEIKLDTEITFIGEVKQTPFEFSQGMRSVDSINPNLFVVKQTYSNQNRKLIREEKDTFFNQQEANRFLYVGEYKTLYKISEEINSKQSLRILPKNKQQQFYFLLFTVIQAISLALLFLNLSKLFRNFARNFYFTYSTINLLKRIGWLMLVPQVFAIIFYWSILFYIHPAKLFVSYSSLDKIKLIYQYDLEAGIDWQLIFIALGIIVLSIIFKNGLKLKEEQALTV